VNNLFRIESESVQKNSESFRARDGRQTFNRQSHYRENKRKRKVKVKDLGSKAF